MVYRVIRTDTCKKEVAKWPPIHRQTEKKLHAQLAENPKSGTTCGLPFLREKRICEKRVYYMVYDDLKLVFLVATSGKKDQQDTIDHVKRYLGIVPLNLVFAIDKWREFTGNTKKTSYFLLFAVEKFVWKVGIKRS